MFTQDIKINWDETVLDDFDISTALMDAGISDTVKMITVPIAKGKFMLRLQNSADLFDSDAETKTVNKTAVI